MFAGNFAPAGWMFCEGQLLPISENEVLFQLIGTTYGGDGESTFSLPDLRSRIPIHQGNGYTMAETIGAEQVTLTTNQLPPHAHQVAGPQLPYRGDGPGNSIAPDGNGLGIGTGKKYYNGATPDRTMGAMDGNIVVGQTGGSQPHDNTQPFLCVSFIISLFGIFPSPT